jgi:hypothetical protein
VRKELNEDMESLKKLHRKPRNEEFLKSNKKYS